MDIWSDVCLDSPGFNSGNVSGTFFAKTGSSIVVIAPTGACTPETSIFPLLAFPFKSFMVVMPTCGSGTFCSVETVVEKPPELSPTCVVTSIAW